MTQPWRGTLAALFLACALIVAAPQTSVASEPALAPGEIVLPDGLTVMIKHGTASGSVALEVWVRCPSDGWTDAQPGIARLTAFTAMSTASNGTTMRDLVRAAGGQIAVSVFQTGTEFTVLAPADAGPALETALLKHIFDAPFDPAALIDAKTRLAAQQAAAGASASAIMRDAVFNALFAGGPLHASTLGDAQAVESTSIADVRAFAAAAYIPQNAIVVSVGNADPAALLAAVQGAAPAGAAAAQPLPLSSPASQASPLALTPLGADAPGAALAWVGPPISDEREATAMDFLSDYLADPDAGVLTHAATNGSTTEDFAGQFITLHQSGVFFVSIAGDGIDPTAELQALRNKLDAEIASPLSKDEFSNALAAYETRLLRQMDSPVGMADNYGWYFVEGAPGYAPSATDAGQSGDYFAQAQSLTPDFVHSVAQKFLGTAPAEVTVVPRKVPVNVSTEGGT
ncbi:MAG TPA: insulinase family protein [Candidatus Eremiobacteraceae bacterium]|nr:insulinase family protein [Candidatus Eremiobacteraceae bacterium]